MAITFPALRANSDKEPNLDQLPSVTIVPIAAVEEAKWTLNLMAIDSADGHVGGNAVVQGAYAERYVPGIVQGHLYKVTYSYINSLINVKVTLGGHTLFTMQSGQAKYDQVKYFTSNDGDKLKIDHDTVGNYTGGVLYLKIEAVDPLNIDLIPDA
jgi:hypothetical protein